MKVLSVKCLESELPDIKKDVDFKVKDYVFEKVKHLFHLTSNKQSVMTDFKARKIDIENKFARLNMCRSQLEKTKQTLSNDVSSLTDELKKSANLLRSSLEE